MSQWPNSRAREALPRRETVRYDELGRQTMLAPNTSGYSSAAATVSALGGRPEGGAEDLHVRYSLDTIRDASRYLDRCNAIFQSLVTRMLDVMLGDGLTLQARTGNADRNNENEAAWNAFWCDPLISGTADGCEVERHAARMMIVDGDVGILRLSDLKIQLIAAERIASLKTKNTITGNRIELGVEIDKAGRHVAYYVCDYDEQGRVNVANPRRILAENMHLMAWRRRADQTRGEPMLQSIFPLIHRISDICDSEASSWQLLSRFAVAIITERGAEEGLAGSTAEPDATSDDLSTRYAEVGSAIMFKGKPGESIQGITRNIPSSNFTESLKTMLRLTGLPIGMSLEFVLMIWSDTNYSSGRASLKQVERGMKRPMNLLIRAMSELYRWVVSKRPDYSDVDDKHDFVPSPYPMLDANKETAANEAQLQAGLTSLTRLMKANGTELHEIVSEWSDELGQIATLCEQHNAKHPSQPITIDQMTALLREKAAAPAAAAATEEIADPADVSSDRPGGTPAKPGDGQDRALSIARAV